jgi:hypothetical protein
MQNTGAAKTKLWMAKFAKAGRLNLHTLIYTHLLTQHQVHMVLGITIIVAIQYLVKPKQFGATLWIRKNVGVTVDLQQSSDWNMRHRLLGTKECLGQVTTQLDHQSIG